jgi:hypothetical protein
MSATINTAEDIQWLKDTALRGVPLPASFQDFQFANLIGNEDAPDYVDLYAQAEPLYTDDFYRIRFDCDAPAYCECVLMNGWTDAPYTGTNTKFAREN